jgi:hypothetical protein
MIPPKRSPREKRMAADIEAVYTPLPGESATETPAERNERINRNWTEIKKARIIELRRRNPKGVKILDAELESGRGIDFPSDASFDVEHADLGAPADDDSDLGTEAATSAPVRASQADVRKSEPAMSLIEQEADERGWEAANLDFIKKTGGVLKPGQTQSQAVSEMSGRRDPRETQGNAEAQHAIDTGELTYGNSVLYNVAKPAAAIAGFAVKGPTGAVGAEALVRATAIASNLNAALDKGMDPEQAGDIFVKELAKGVGIDAVFNFGAPILGHVIAKIPGVKRMGDAIQRAIERRLGAASPKPDLRTQKLEDLKGMTADPNRKAAIDELAGRVPDDTIPTPGQVTGKTGFLERRTYEAFPGEFETQKETLGEAAEQFRKGVVDPASQPTAQRLGEQIDRFVESTVKATKDRLRPVFESANKANMVVDMKSVADIARDALRKNRMVMGRGKLTDAEVAHLQKVIDGYKYQPYRAAEATLDFLSVQKDMLRKLNPDAQPSKFFSIVVGDMEKATKASFDESARRTGQTGLVKTLEQAWRDYRVMNESAYTGAMKQVLKKGDDAAEDIGSYLWAKGKVSRIDDLDEMLKLGAREGVASQQAIDKLRRNVARGFVQQGVQNIEQAANWSKSLADPQRRATWDALTRDPLGQALRNSMEVLEHAAQIASKAPKDHQSKFLGVPTSRAIGGGLGISWVTFGFNPVLFGAGLGLAGTTRLLATAYVHGDRGTINLIDKVLRMNSVGKGAAIKALQAALPDLKAAADKYGVNPFLTEDREEQSDQQLGKPE